MVSWNVTYNPKQGVKAERAPLHYSKGGGSKEAAIPFSGMLRKKEFPQMAVSELPHSSGTFHQCLCGLCILSSSKVSRGFQYGHIELKGPFSLA